MSSEQDDIREEMSATGKLGDLTSILHKYMDEAGVVKSRKIQRRVRLLSIKHQQALLEIKALKLELQILKEDDVVSVLNRIAAAMAC